MSPEETNNLKCEALQLLIRHSPYVFVVVNTQARGVRMPEGLDPVVTVQIGNELAVPIPDIQLDERGLTMTLSFNRANHPCYMPWASIIGARTAGGEVMVGFAGVEAEEDKPRLTIVGGDG